MKKQNLMKGQPLPDQIDGFDLVCLTTKIPNDPKYIAAVHGVFKRLEHYSWWEKSGEPSDTRAAQAAAYWRLLNNQFLTIEECVEPLPQAPVPAGLTVGMVIPYAGTLPLPDGLLLCDGAIYDGALYPELYTLINPVFRNGPNFSTPDMGSRMVVGFDNNTAIDGVFSTTFNTEQGTGKLTLTTPLLPSHNHTVPSHNHGQTPHTHTMNSHTHTSPSHNHTQNSHTHVQDAHTHVQTPHSHPVQKRDSAAAFGTGIPASSSGVATTTFNSDNAQPTNQNTTATNQGTVATNNGTVATIDPTTATMQSASAGITAAPAVDTTNTGSGTPFVSMNPYRVLYYVIVAKTITGGVPRDVIMSSSPSQAGKCNKLYWRYEDELPAANRLLFETCNGDDGAVGDEGATGADGSCPDCEEQVPAPVTEAPQGCKVATGIVDYALGKYIDLLTGYIDQVINNGVSLLDFGEWAQRIIFYNGNPATALANLIAWIAAQQAQGALDNLDCANDLSFSDDLICALYCVMPLDGNFTSDVFADWRAKINNEINTPCTEDFLNFLTAMTITDLRVEALAAIQFGIESDCSNCPCGCSGNHPSELLASLGCQTPLSVKTGGNSVVGAVYRLTFDGTYTRDTQPGVTYDWFYADNDTGNPIASVSQITVNVPNFDIPEYRADHTYKVYLKGDGAEWEFKRFPRYSDCHGSTHIEVSCYQE